MEFIPWSLLVVLTCLPFVWSNCTHVHNILHRMGVVWHTDNTLARGSATSHMGAIVPRSNRTSLAKVQVTAQKTSAFNELQNTQSTYAVHVHEQASEAHLLAQKNIIKIALLGTGECGDYLNMQMLFSIFMRCIISILVLQSAFVLSARQTL